MKHKVLMRYPLGNPRRKWRMDNFVINVASAGPMDSTLVPKDDLTRRKTRRGVKTTIDAGFNLMGCLWAEPELAMDIVRTAERYGGNVLFQDIKRFGGNHRQRFGPVNDYAGAIRDTAQWNCIKGYCLWDEPIFPEHLEETRRMVDYCEQVRPDLLPYTVANPSYHSKCSWEKKEFAPYIDRFLDIIEPAQLDFDYYPIGKRDYVPENQLDNCVMWSDMEIVRRAAQKREIPFWFCYQAQAFPWHPIFCPFHFNMARSMAFGAVLYGAKGLCAYTEFAGFIDPTTGGPGVFFEEQKKLNNEIAALGNTLMALRCLRVIHDENLLKDHLSMEDIRTGMEESEFLTGTLHNRISVSEHEDNYGNKYLMVLNRDYDNTAYTCLKFKKPYHVYEVSKEDGEQYLRYERAKNINVYLQPGDLILYRLQDAEEEPYTIEYCLDK